MHRQSRKSQATHEGEALFAGPCAIPRVTVEDSSEREARELRDEMQKLRYCLESCREGSSKEGPASRDDLTALALELFLKSKPADQRNRFYSVYLPKSFPPLSLFSTPLEIEALILNLQAKPGGKHAYFRAIRAFFNWAYSPASGLGLRQQDNPVLYLKGPKVPKRLMPAQTAESLKILLSSVKTVRDGAILSVLGDSGGRVREVANIEEAGICWDKHCVRAVAKGGDEVKMPLGPESEVLLRAWLSEYSPNGGNIWGLSQAGIVSMLRRLEKTTGMKCNAHTFRRGFASILRRNGVDILDIMKLGHWKSMPMVQRYTESVDFEDSMQRYVAPVRPADAARGLDEDNLVPRSRVELLTRGFSVRCSTT